MYGPSARVRIQIAIRVTDCPASSPDMAGRCDSLSVPSPSGVNKPGVPGRPFKARGQPRAPVYQGWPRWPGRVLPPHASPHTHRVVTGWIGRRGDYIERGSVNALIPLGDQSPYDRGWTPPSFVSRVRGSPAAAARCGASPTPRTGQTREICRRTLGLASRQWPAGNATSSSAPSTRSPSRPPRQADDFVHEEIAIGHDRSDPSTRRSCGLELLRVTADLQRELGTFLDTRVPARRGESIFLSRLQSDGPRAARWIYERVYARR
jgi:hypothetical protein